MSDPATAALIVAAGRGSRFGQTVPKQYAALAGEPVLRHTIRAFRDHPGIDVVQAVIHPDDTALYEQAVGDMALNPPVAGGDTRQASVLNGLTALAPLRPDNVLIHDAARPLVSADLIGRTIDALSNAAGAIAAVPVHDPATIAHTVPRDRLWRAQTPQGFRFNDIIAAHRDAAGQTLTDDAAVAERAGLSVALVEGSEDNFKVTTSQDLVRAERLMQASRPAMQRVGTGFDVHRFATDGDHVMLCGVAVPHERGLAGHSDADVGLHALVDALLGAIAAGDIGDHFPPSDARWAGAESSLFVEHARDLVDQANGVIENVDLTLICQTPRVGPYREAMRARVAELLAVPMSAVSVKATTTEGLGFTGRSEGIAAQAVASVRIAS
jgi:2-C-methyl-D-erythritol 4-phosphate cytidylyltransferase/2-C-methyl-D-erythritol 2,4-cyclodiphosphate synthase